MKRSLLAVMILVLPVLVTPTSAVSDGGAHEVWVIDQSDTTAGGGGSLYIYDGARLSGSAAATAPAEVVDLGGAAEALCLARTGTAPRRPHMMMFNGAQSHAVIAYVATGHVLFLDAATRSPVGCVDVGVQAHAAVPSPDETYVVVANQNGKLLQRIRTDYAVNAFTLDAAASLDLAACVTPNGSPCQDPVLRPDNAPICPVATADGRHVFVTLRGGGMFVVNPATSPMAIVAEYDKAAVHPNGCGGVEAGGSMYINSGGGTPANPVEHDVYRFDLAAITAANAPNRPAPVLVYSHDSRGFVDSHGATVTRHGRFLWVADRAANGVVVVDAADGTVVDEFGLAGDVSGDPAPDLMATSSSGNRVFVSLRGPNPLTGNAPGVNNAVGSTPGVGVVRVEKNGAGGVLQAMSPISHVVGGVERADPHAIAVRSR